MIYFSRKIYDEMVEHAQEAYPHEACGALIGEQKSEFAGKKQIVTKNILKIHRMQNINKDRAHDRYEINPKELFAIEKEAKAKGLDVIGFYHSHPDHPGSPSAFDRERGWPLYSYVIISVKDGSGISVKAWMFEDDKEPFDEEEIKIIN